MVVTHVTISTALRFRLDSSNFDSLPDTLKKQCSEIRIDSVTFGLDNDVLWVVHCKQFSTLKLSDLEQFEMWYWTPAKGRGGISVGAGYRDDRQGSEILGSFDDYSDDNLASAKSYINELQKVLGYLPKVTCYGADC